MEEDISYIGRIRQFGWNARMYLLHIFGMDVIHGAWEVLFNLYLLLIFPELGIAFVGLRIAVMGIAGALSSIPMGKFADRIDRKWGFIIGDGGGAACSLILIMSVDPTTILAFSAIAACFGSLHHVTEVPFMAENSSPGERIHLFAVGSGFRTLAAMFGAIVAGILPAYLGDIYDIEIIEAYRLAVQFAIAWWFLSLIPAFLLRRLDVEFEEHPEGKTGLFSGIRNPLPIRRFIIVSATLAFGAGFVIPLANVFFHEHSDIHAGEKQIGMIFAAGSLALSIGAFMVPLVVDRLGEIPTIIWTRFAAIPFILMIGFAPELASPETVVSIAGLAWVLRTTLFNMSSPVMEAFTMSKLEPSERATFVGISRFFGAGLIATGGFLGARMMADGNYSTPFIIMAVAYAISTMLFMQWFGAHSDPEDLAEINR
ncbi:MAG TPA: MFS transporter [Candidatus Poseidoniales archaeon]|nr:MAG: hypothetical protein CXT64_03460 [Euryarchaeota archaeon]HIE81122.1 MFS transporter [Candidatus Poseidoniales archaeon]HIL49793.1 MFS transporter [Candidatus Poseidoniales archaeon]